MLFRFAFTVVNLVDHNFKLGCDKFDDFKFGSHFKAIMTDLKRYNTLSLWIAAETGGSFRGMKSPKPIVVSDIMIKYIESSIDQSSTQLNINVGITIKNPDP